MQSAESSFEEPLVELRRKIEELSAYPPGDRRDREIARLEGTLEKRTREIFSGLSRWQTTLVARHPERPYTLDYIERLMDDWVEIHGDRAFSDDPAVVAGFARFRGRTVAVVGHQKGRGTRERIHRNFGQPRPEGYRKAQRVLRLAERYGRPVVSLIDTAGAYPGVGAEERGQAESIADNLLVLSRLRVPIVVTVTGEGGSGGALALGVGDRIHMLEYATYSVISPEGCAAILWKDQAKKAEAAEALKLTAADLRRLGLVDEVIPEPLGGAHTDPEETCRRVGDRLEAALDRLQGLPADELLETRYEKLRRMGVFEER
jgi:acetyl-CoA carboxylase carboxyl transferase subunit alpha